jgi:4-amino-4-deoxy-L-arabinose transferase-like glycosyltransferase
VSWRARLLAAALGLAVFLPGIASRDLWNPDEPRYAEVTREMRASGDWFVPHLNGAIYAEKPPLLFWLIGLASLATGGVDEVAARLPSALAAIAALFCLFEIGRRWFDEPTAWLATLVYASSAKILWQGRVGQIDMLLGALVALAMLFWTRGFLERRPGFYRAFFVATGFATLAKGPVGLLPPLLAIVAYLLATKRRDAIRDLRIPTGLLIWAAIVLLWLVPAVASAGREYFDTIVFRQNVTRYAEPWHHFQPFYYYLTILPADFFPWFFFLPGALWLGWQRIGDPRRAGFRFALSWFLVTLVFFSLSPAKRTVYILSMYPGLALLVAVGLSEIGRHRDALRRWAAIPAAIAAAIVGAAAIAIPLLARGRSELAPLGPAFPWEVGGLLLAIALAFTYGARVAARGRVARMTIAMAAGLAAAVAVASLLLLPQFNALKTARPLAQRLLALATPSEPYAIYPRIDPPFLFYTRRFARLPRDEAELQAYCRAADRVWLLIQRDDLARLATPLPMFEVARDLDPVEGYVLMTNRLADSEDLAKKLTPHV